MANENERSDISLCFQALGIEFGAPPEDVEKAYQRMIAEIKKKQASPNPSVRAEAANDMELAHDLYEKIRNSLTYNTKLREAEHLASTKQQPQKLSAAQNFKICPSCGKTIGAALKKCPFCKKPLLTPFEQLINKIFSLKSFIITVILLAIIAGAVFLINPDVFKLKKSATPPEITPSFSNVSSSSFSNLSGATQKP